MKVLLQPISNFLNQQMKKIYKNVSYNAISNTEIPFSMMKTQIVVCNIANSCENGDEHIYLTYIKVNRFEAIRTNKKII